MRSEFQNIEPRYRQDAPCTDEDRAKIWADVQAAQDKTFGVRKYRDSCGELVLRGSDGNGEFTARSPSESPAWRRRIEKARREIEEHRQHIDWRETIEAAHREWPLDDVADLKQFIEGQYA